MLPSLEDFLERLEAGGVVSAEVVHRSRFAARPAEFGELAPALPAGLERALGEVGAGRLWSHQVAGLGAAREGLDVLVTTPTASGKSLVFQVPVLEEALRGGKGRALFLFPLKALGQDQKAKLEALARLAGLEGEVAAIYDGDTPAEARRRIRAEPPRVLITTPDMLHLGILAHSGSWAKFLRELRFLVLDELHVYRGVFGSHFHHVLARLFRLCRRYGSRPTLIASSATAANAAAFAEALSGRSFFASTASGAPQEERHLVLLRPAASPYTAALELLGACLEAGLKTIVFTKARRITELLASWLRRRSPELARRVANYRAGFLPEERREIERRLFAGEIDGVISTSALEMGIDVGGLDACILVGYPGSVMATWQRSGRVGRAGRPSLTALIALPDALDQYLLDHPQTLLERPCERLLVNPDNAPVARAHLLCAAAEQPLSRVDDAAYLERHAAEVRELVAAGELLEAAGGSELFSVRRSPQRAVSLRGAGRPMSIRAGAKGPTIGFVDGSRAMRECHPGAVYLHAGRTYLVDTLDLDNREVHAQAAEVQHFTTPLTDKETEILEVLGQRTDGPLSAWLGRLRVTERVIGYERKHFATQQVLGQHPLDLPPVDFETVGLWFVAGQHLRQTLEEREEHFMGALHAAEHAAISLLPTFALCDRGDVGGISIPFHPQVGSGAVFLYDGHEGGIGIAAGAFADLPALLGRVLELLAACPCESGCPSCVQSPKCGNGNRPLDKAGAARLLRLLLGQEAPVVAAGPVPEVVLAARRVEEEPMNEQAPAAAAPAPEAPAAKPARPRARKAAGAASAPVGDRPPSTVLFDLETLRSADDVGGWSNVHRMGVAVGVLCFLEENRFEVYREERVRELVAALKSGTLVVGFNSRRFDYRVLNGYTGEDYGRSLPTLDLLEEVERRLGHRLSLDHLCTETLGATKSADGLQSLEWVKQGRYDLVEEYCRHDVELLRDLYLFGRREGFVRYRKRGSQTPDKLPVDW